MRENRRTLLTRGLVFGIRLYRNSFSHMLLHSCRFFPTCSEYAIRAIEHYGAWRGMGLAALRLLRCHPLARGGFDPVNPALKGGVN